jgi:hypothetical protein
MLFLTVFFVRCNKYEEVAPFTDGLFLEYRSGGMNNIYNFERLEKFNYKVTETEIRKPLSDKVIEFFVDNYGRVYKSSVKDYEGEYSPVWIPLHAMKIGDSYDGVYKVARRDQWKKWDVMVVKNPDFDEEQYFELNTGYLVGVKGEFGLSYELVLVNTNANIPTIE